MADALPAVDAIDRNALVDRRGRAYRAVKAGLVPRWWRVWADVAGGYAALAATAVALDVLERTAPRMLLLWILVGALLFGWTIAFIQLFLHEAAHWNLAPDRTWNDRLANLFVGSLTGQDVAAYRRVHFDHHRHLGTPRDTERSYFAALDGRFLAEALCGVAALRVLRTRDRALATADVDRPGRRRAMLVAGILLNAGVVALAAATGRWAIAVAWPLGIAAVHPAINATRQLLEHRSFEARRDVDYAAVAHGPVTRMFAGRLVSRTLGGAGFDRHLLHHWEPQLSYTRLADLEAFLLDTPSGAVFRAQTTTYGRAFRRLFRA